MGRVGRVSACSGPVIEEKIKHHGEPGKHMEGAPDPEQEPKQHEHSHSPNALP
jgi:hypothetical protein